MSARSNETVAHTVTAIRWPALIARLQDIARRYPDAAMASSLAAEDMVLTHAIAESRAGVHIFTLDTGRLHAETLGMIDVVRRRYGIEIEVFHPDAAEVDAHVQAHGAFAFYDSVDLRKACCHIRKVEPLQRALKQRAAWLTGQRREQAATRVALPEEGHDDIFGLYKFNPLAEWSHDEIWHAIEAFGVPYNPLHDQGYPSIGCDPCTRPVRPGEDVRAGRWWWEQADSKECGLHAGNRPAIPIKQAH